MKINAIKRVGICFPTRLFFYPDKNTSSSHQSKYTFIPLRIKSKQCGQLFIFVEKNERLWKKSAVFIKIVRFFLKFRKDFAFFKWLSTKNRSFFHYTQSVCGRVIHRFSPLFRGLRAESLILKNSRGLSTAHLSTFFKKVGWTTPCYPHFAWISGEKWGYA